MQPKKKVGENEIDRPLWGESGKYQIIKIYGTEFLETQEYSDSRAEVSQRLKYLNNRCWKVVYMARKKQ